MIYKIKRRFAFAIEKLKCMVRGHIVKYRNDGDDLIIFE